MATLTESPQVALVSVPKLPASPSPSLFALSRLVVPALCISLGVSVGSAAGLTLALVNAPNNTVAASSNSTQASQASQASAARAQGVVPLPQPAGPAPMAANTSRPASANPLVKVQAPNTVQIALNKTPDAVKPAMFKLAGKEWHVAKPIAIPVAQPARQGLPSALAAASTALDGSQSGLDAAAKPAALYTEGDLTVADFDATDGTLQASDGTTFVLGTTVAASYATSWNSYHSLVHYRCDQAGSCVLMRAGAVAPNARLI